MDIGFITSNAAKVQLANERLNRYGIIAVQKKLKLIEPQTIDVTEVAIQKAKQAKNELKTPFIVEDSGLYVDRLNGFPGAMMAPVLDSIGDEGILKLMKGENNRSALVRSVLAYCDQKSEDIKVFTGLYNGTLAMAPAGMTTRGWRLAKIFIPEGFSKALAEMDDSEWTRFLAEFRKDDHYEKFGSWLKANV